MNTICTHDQRVLTFNGTPLYSRLAQRFPSRGKRLGMREFANRDERSADIDSTTRKGH